MRKRTMDLTEGPIGKKLLLFAIPLLLGSLVQQLYNTVDLLFVGNFISKSASAAIGASSMLITCLVGFFGGMGVGSGVVISHTIGSKDRDRLSKAIHNTAALALAGGLGLMVVGYFVAPVYIRLVRSPMSIRADAVSYLRIYFLSFISVVSYNFGSGVLRATGDSRSPLMAQLLGGLMNVAMDYLFVRVFENGINGVAWATLISQSTAAAYVIYRLSVLDPDYALRVKKIAFQKDILLNVINIGIPAGAQSLLITLSNVIAQYHINGLGEDALAAFTTYYKVELLIYLPIVALGQATMTFVGQNKGAGKLDRVRRGTVQCCLMSMCLAAATGIVCLLNGEHLFRAFLKDEAVIALGCRIIAVTFPFYSIYSILQVFGDSMRGVGKSRGPMIIVMANICIIRSLILFSLVPNRPDVTSVAMSYPITWTLTSVCMLAYYLSYHKKLKQNQDLKGCC